MADFYRLRVSPALFGWGDAIGEVPVGARSLSEHQAAIIRKCGGRLFDAASAVEIPRGRDAFWFDDDLYFSEGFVRAALRSARGKTRPLRFCLRQNSFNERYCLPDGAGFSAPDPELPLRPRFGFSPSSGPSTEAEDVILEQRIFRNPLRIPRPLIAAGEFSYDQCSVAASRVFTPFHLLQANLSELFNATAPVREKLPQWFQNRFLKPYSKFFYFLMRRQNRIGKNCLVHPSAILEGVTLGDDVTVGANVILRMCRVGAGTLIEDGSIIKYCVLGKNNYICNGNQLVSCVTLDNVFLIHGPYQFSIFGRDVVAMAVLNCDVRLDHKTIQIPSPAGLLDSKQPLLGIAYGHGAKVGAGNSIAPGRIVPNDCRMNPPNIVLKF